MKEHPDVIEGRNPVLEALLAGRPLNKIVLAVGIERHGVVNEILRLARENSIPVEYLPRSAVGSLSTSREHRGVIAYAAVKDYVNYTSLLDIARQKNELPFLVVLDGIEDPHNLGAILRTAEAAGVHGVIIRSRRAVGLTGAVARASAGAVEYVPVARVSSIVQTLQELKKENIWVVGIDQEGETDYSQVDLGQATAIVVGGEGKGLSRPVKQACDVIARIPMRGKINSLNASVAAAVVMYEALKQRLITQLPKL